ncbi:hypothetical protein IIV6-T1_285 [Invertebrate iridescent virus 6]|nr:hypothetical protein IIV6-T1_285 [Invertebrate iridescent virus 6]
MIHYLLQLYRRYNCRFLINCIFCYLFPVIIYKKSKFCITIHYCVYKFYKPIIMHYVQFITLILTKTR